MDSLSEYIENSLRLTVNRTKSVVDRPWKRGYLGYRLTWHKQPKLTLAKASLKRMMQRVRETLKRRRKLQGLGLNAPRAWKSAGNGRGPWWNAGASHMNQALPRKWFYDQGLNSVLDTVRGLNRSS